MRHKADVHMLDFKLKRDGHYRPIHDIQSLAKSLRHVEGTVELGPPGEPVADHLERGAFIGELAALCGLPRATDAIARSLTRILAVDVGTLDRLLDDRPEVTRQMLSILAKRLAQTPAVTLASG